MSISEGFLVVNNIKISVNASQAEAFSVAKAILKKASLLSYAKEYSIFKRSIDARKKPDIYFIYSIAVKGDFPEIGLEILARYGISLQKSFSNLTFEIGELPLSAPPVIVGSGPCGLFAALLLAEQGYAPIILERGGSIQERRTAVERFNSEHILDTNTNIQFGAGGAGTFSDGKLVTRINDPLTNYVLDTFVKFGAPEEIRYVAKPHIGTDILSGVVDKMLDYITSLGGRILYHTTFISAKSSSAGMVESVLTSAGEIKCGALILGIGHSARDTYDNLFNLNLVIEPKPFSVGMRIEHLADDIDYALYGSAASNPLLGRAEYALSYNTKSRGSYTFCMCPGGVVVAATSEEGSVCVNGMSYHARDGRNSNSAVLTSVNCDDYGNTPRGAIDFQRRIERKTFISGGGGYAAPIITVGDFISGECKTEPKRILPSYMSSTNVNLAHPDEYLPDFICTGLKNAILAFDNKIKGFAVNDAVLTGSETRTSAPVRIIRDKDSRLAIGYKNLFPAGEGAGYAGGITSAAVDGAKSAMALMNIYKSK